MPWSGVVIARLQAHLRDPINLIEMFRLPAILLGDAPARELACAQFLETLELRLMIGVQIDFHDAHAVVYQHFFELKNALDRALIVLLGVAALDDAAEVLAVPDGEKERYASTRRQLLPVAPHRRELAILGGR